MVLKEFGVSLAIKFEKTNKKKTNNVIMTKKQIDKNQNEQKTKKTYRSF